MSESAVQPNDYVQNIKNKEILLSHLEKISGDMDAIIKEQIHWLVSKTTSVPEFGLILVQNGQLNRDSFERIKKEYRFDNDQSQEIYRVVAKCGNWKALIHAWNGSNNQHIIRDLPTRLQIRRDNVAAESGNANPEIRIQEQAIKIPNDPENPPGDEGDITSNINTSYPITRRSKQEVCLTHLIHNKRSLQLLIICLWILAAMAITTLVVTCAFLAKNLIHTQSNIFSTPHVNDANQSSLSRGNHSTGSPDTFENSTQLDWKYSTPDGVTTENTFPSISTVGGDNYENWTSAYTEIVNVIYSDSSMNKFKNPIKIIEIADPLRILPATKGTGSFYLLIVRNNFHDLHGLYTSIPGTVRSVQFQGSININNVTAIIKTFRHSLVNITFVFDNMLCGEFSNFKISFNTSKVEVPLLHEIQFVGDTNCFHVFKFVFSTLAFQNIRVLKFLGNHIMSDSVKSVKTILRVSQNSLEYLILEKVSFCNNCNAFKSLFFPNMKYAKLVVGLGGNTLDIRDKMFDFNNIMPDKCISSNPDKKSLIVFCPGLL